MLYNSIIVVCMHNIYYVCKIMFFFLVQNCEHKRITCNKQHKVDLNDQLLSYVQYIISFVFYSCNPDQISKKKIIKIISTVKYRARLQNGHDLNRPFLETFFFCPSPVCRRAILSVSGRPSDARNWYSRALLLLCIFYILLLFSISCQFLHARSTHCL